MGRLPGFDYKRPFFYMVTLKGTHGVSFKTPFCTISETGEVVPNAIADAFDVTIRHFHETWWCIEPIRHHVIMPDHLHILVKMRDVEGRVSLAVVVRQLLKHLETEGRKVLQKTAAEQPLQNPIFEHEWHDWIVKKEWQLAAFRKYIRENPRRHARRRANRRFFTKARQITFQGKRYWAYGNEALLELPVIVAIKGHRRPALVSGPSCATRRRTVLQGALRAPDEPSEASMQTAMRRDSLLAAADRIDPGGAGLSTFLSPLEKNASNAIIKAGGSLIVLSTQGFGERWHPTEKQERLCAAGRMLYLSPYEPQSTKLDKREMHIRAHSLVDWALGHSNYHMEAWP